MRPPQRARKPTSHSPPSSDTEGGENGREPVLTDTDTHSFSEDSEASLFSSVNSLINQNRNNSAKHGGTSKTQGQSTSKRNNSGGKRHTGRDRHFPTPSNPVSGLHKIKYILSGHSNLHRSANNAAQMSTYICRQMHAFKLNNWGQVVKSSKVPKNNKRQNKPSTVSEWSQSRKHSSNANSQDTAPAPRSSYPGRGQFYLRDEVVPNNQTPTPSVTDSLESQVGRDIDDLSSYNSDRPVDLEDVIEDVEERETDFHRNLQNLMDEARAAANPSGNGGPGRISSNNNSARHTSPRVDDSMSSTPAGVNDTQETNPDYQEEETLHKPLGYVFGLLEPAIMHDQVVNMGGAEAIFDKTIPNDQIRAALIFNPQMNIWEVSEFCNRDMATGLLTGTDLGDVYVVSLYCHNDLPAVPRRFRQLAARAKTEGRELLVLSDLNSHSQALWGGEGH